MLFGVAPKDLARCLQRACLPGPKVKPELLRERVGWSGPGLDQAGLQPRVAMIEALEAAGPKATDPAGGVWGLPTQAPGSDSRERKCVCGHACVFV